MTAQGAWSALLLAMGLMGQAAPAGPQLTPGQVEQLVAETRRDCATEVDESLQNFVHLYPHLDPATLSRNTDSMIRAMAVDTEAQLQANLALANSAEANQPEYRKVYAMNRCIITHILASRAH